MIYLYYAIWSIPPAINFSIFALMISAKYRYRRRRRIAAASSLCSARFIQEKYSSNQKIFYGNKCSYSLWYGIKRHTPRLNFINHSTPQMLIIDIIVHRHIRFLTLEHESHSQSWPPSSIPSWHGGIHCQSRIIIDWKAYFCSSIVCLFVVGCCFIDVSFIEC